MIRTPYLVLFIFLGAISIGAVSALITITLDGDVIITGNTELQGDLTCTNCIESSDVADNSLTGEDIQDESVNIDDISSPTLGELTCDSNEVARWNGAGWVCSSISVVKNSQVIDSTGFAGLYTSLDIVNGKPAISYQGNSDDLRYIQAIDASGSAWNPPCYCR